MGLYVSRVKATDERETPHALWEAYDREFGFTLDVCAAPGNAKCSRFFTAQDDGLAQDWGTHVCWMNPPYSNCGAWVRKAAQAAQAGATVVALVPSATDTRWWHECTPRAEVRFLRGRLRFVGTKGSAPFPSAILIFRPGESREPVNGSKR